MPKTPTPKQKRRIDNLTEGKKTLKDTAAFLIDVLTIVETGNLNELASLPAKVDLLIKGVDKISSHIDQALRLEENLSLAKDLISSSTAQENRDLVVQDRLQQSAKTKERKSLHEQRLENATKHLQSKRTATTSSPTHPSKKRRSLPSNNKSNNNEDGKILISKLENYEAPGVEGSRYCLRQLVSLIKVDCNSPIFQCIVSNFIAKLREADKCIVSYHTLRRRIIIYEEKEILPREGDEGTAQGRPKTLIVSKLQK